MGSGMSGAARPRCPRCGEPVGPGQAACPRCVASPVAPGLPARFASYDPERQRAPLYHYFSGVRFFVGSLAYVLTTRGVKRHIATPIVISIALLALLVVGSFVGASWLVGP